MTLQSGRGGGRWALAPELIDEPIRRDDSIRIEQREREERSLLRPSQGKGPSGLAHFDRSKNAEFHRALAVNVTAAEPRNHAALARAEERFSGDLARTWPAICALRDVRSVT
jgi:hypothetical protein